MSFKYALPQREQPQFYPEYLFRITSGAGTNPFIPGASSQTLDLGKNKSIYLYFSPVLYSWIRHWFENAGDKLYAIVRPKTLPSDLMACGLNSHYHYCFTKRRDLLPKMVKAILTKDYKDPELQKMFKEHESRVMQKFGKKLSEMKGGEYLATLQEFDTLHPANAYPEIIMDPKLLAGCKWEELE